MTNLLKAICLKDIDSEYFFGFTFCKYFWIVPFRLPYYLVMFTEPEVNNCFRVIAQVLSSSVVNRFVVETILLQLELNRFI